MYATNSLDSDCLKVILDNREEENNAPLDLESSIFPKLYLVAKTVTKGLSMCTGPNRNPVVDYPGFCQ